MTHYLKLLTACMLFCMPTIFCNAQDIRKEAIFVDYFMKTPDIPIVFVKNIREQVIVGIQNRGRLMVLDGERYPKLSPGPVSAYENVSDNIANRENEIKKTGARFVLGGMVTDYRFDRKKNGNRQSFSSYMTVMIWGYDLKTNQKFDQQIYKISGYGATMDEADARAMGSIHSRMDYFVMDNFKFETNVIGLCNPTINDKKERIYIAAGTAIGVRNTDQFDIYVEEIIGGSLVRSKVGRVTVREVNGPNVSICTMKKKEAPIITNLLNHNKKLVAVSAGQSIL